MKTRNESNGKEEIRPKHNTALGIYVILTSTFVAAYTLIQLVTVM